MTLQQKLHRPEGTCLIYKVLGGGEKTTTTKTFDKNTQEYSSGYS